MNENENKSQIQEIVDDVNYVIDDIRENNAAYTIAEQRKISSIVGMLAYLTTRLFLSI